MGGRGGSSGQGDRRQRSGDGMGGGTQSDHALWYNADDIAYVTGVSEQRAKDYFSALSGDGRPLYEGGPGGFTGGWDSAIRAVQRGESDEQILRRPGTKSAIDEHFNGDKDAYLKELRKKAADVERLIDDSPKWVGGETFRGFRDMSPSQIAQLTTVGNKVDLNNGTASWSTSESVAKGFADYDYGNGHVPSGSFVAHVSAGTTRRGTSVKNLSLYKSEDEVLCSKNEAFLCTRVETRANGEVHAYYDLVGTNHRWKYSR